MDTQRSLLLLGAYGNTGRPLARLLLQETDVCLVLAGRNAAKAAGMAGELSRIYGEGRVTGLALDACDPAALRQAFENITMVVVASSTARYAPVVAGAALEAGTDYLDIQYSTQKVAFLKSISGKLEEAGRCFITDGGFHPGLPAVLVRYAATCFDSLEKANVGSVMKEDWSRLDVPDETLAELLEEINDFVPLIFKGGQWKKAGLIDTRDFVRMDFGSPFGRQTCAPMFLEEMRAIPELYPTIKETGFFVGSFNPFVDYFILPLAMVALKISPHRALKPMAKLMKWGLDTFSKPPYGTALKLEAQGMQSGQAKAIDLMISHRDGYLFTAIPVVACLLQYLEGSIRKPGLWTQAHLVEPGRLMHDMQRMGVELQMADTPMEAR